MTQHPLKSSQEAMMADSIVHSGGEMMAHSASLRTQPDGGETVAQLQADTHRAADGPAAHREWRCFQCDDLFTSHEEASDHFGRFVDCTPACKIGAERFRAMETELHEYRTESDAASKTFYSLGADHRTALVRAEQEGYDKGLADGRADAAPVPASQPGIDRQVDEPQAPCGEVERLRAALRRQTENMSSVLSRVDLGKWGDKFDCELSEDRAALEASR